MRNDEENRQATGGGIALGLLLSVVPVVASFFTSVMILGLGWSDHVGPAAVLLIWLLIGVVYYGAGILISRRSGWTGVMIGLIIGAALYALFLSVCGSLVLGVY